jgi:hypothetical protein
LAQLREGFLVFANRIPAALFSWESDIGRRSVSITSRDVVLFNENGEDAKGQFVSNPAGKLFNR